MGHDYNSGGDTELLRNAKVGTRYRVKLADAWLGVSLVGVLTHKYHKPDGAWTLAFNGDVWIDTLAHAVQEMEEVPWVQ